MGNNTRVFNKDFKDAKASRSLKKPRDIDYTSKMGYQDGSPFANRPYIDINTPDGMIDMSNTGIPLMANGQFLPPYSGMHNMGTPMVREVAMAMYGGDPSLPGITGHYPFGGQYTKTHTHFGPGGLVRKFEDLNQIDDYSYPELDPGFGVNVHTPGSRAIPWSTSELSSYRDDPWQIIRAQKNKPGYFNKGFNINIPEGYNPDPKFEIPIQRELLSPMRQDPKRPGLSLYAPGGDVPPEKILPFSKRFIFRPEDLANTGLQDRAAACHKGECLEGANTYYNKYVSPMFSMPDTWKTNEMYGIMSGNENMPYGISADSWDLAAELQKKGAIQNYAAPLYDENNVRNYEREAEINWNKLTPEEKKKLYSSMALGTLVNYGDYGSGSEYRRSGSNEKAGLYPSRHSARVVGYMEDGMPVVYDWGKLRRLDESGLGHPITNITTPKEYSQYNYDYVKNWQDKNAGYEYNPEEKLFLYGRNTRAGETPIEEDELKFVNGINDNIKRLMEVTGSTQEDVIKAGKVAFGIMQGETRGGRGSSYAKLKEMVKSVLPGTGEASKGYTRMKKKTLAGDETNRYSQYLESLGLDPVKMNLWDPSTSALATTALILSRKGEVDGVDKWYLRAQQHNQPAFGKEKLDYLKRGDASYATNVINNTSRLYSPGTGYGISETQKWLSEKQKAIAEDRQRLENIKKEQYAREVAKQNPDTLSKLKSAASSDFIPAMESMPSETTNINLKDKYMIRKKKYGGWLDNLPNSNKANGGNIDGDPPFYSQPNRLVSKEEFVKSLGSNDPYYRLNQPQYDEQGTLRWTPLNNQQGILREADLKDVDFGKLYQRNKTGLDLGYLHNNIWVNKRMGLHHKNEPFGTTEPGYDPYQFEVGYGGYGEYPSVYFVTNPAEDPLVESGAIKAKDSKIVAPEGALNSLIGKLDSEADDFNNPYYSELKRKYQSVKPLIGDRSYESNLKPYLVYADMDKYAAEQLKKQGKKGEYIDLEEGPLMKIYGNENMKLKGVAPLTKDDYEHLKNISNDEEGKKYLAEKAGIPESEIQNLWMHYSNTQPKDYLNINYDQLLDQFRQPREYDDTYFMREPVKLKKHGGWLDKYAPGGEKDDPKKKKKASTELGVSNDDRFKLVRPENVKANEVIFDVNPFTGVAQQREAVDLDEVSISPKKPLVPAGVIPQNVADLIAKDQQVKSEIRPSAEDQGVMSRAFDAVTHPFAAFQEGFAPKSNSAGRFSSDWLRNQQLEKGRNLMDLAVYGAAAAPALEAAGAYAAPYINTALNAPFTAGSVSLPYLTANNALLAAGLANSAGQLINPDSQLYSSIGKAYDDPNTKTIIDAAGNVINTGLGFLGPNYRAAGSAFLDDATRAGEFLTSGAQNLSNRFNQFLQNPNSLASRLGRKMNRLEPLPEFNREEFLNSDNLFDQYRNRLNQQRPQIQENITQAGEAAASNQLPPPPDEIIIPGTEMSFSRPASSYDQNTITAIEDYLRRSGRTDRLNEFRARLNQQNVNPSVYQPNTLTENLPPAPVDTDPFGIGQPQISVNPMSQNDIDNIVNAEDFNAALGAWARENNISTAEGIDNAEFLNRLQTNHGDRYGVNFTDDTAPNFIANVSSDKKAKVLRDMASNLHNTFTNEELTAMRGAAQRQMQRQTRDAYTSSVTAHPTVLSNDAVEVVKKSKVSNPKAVDDVVTSLATPKETTGYQSWTTDDIQGPVHTLLDHEKHILTNEAVDSQLKSFEEVYDDLNKTYTQLEKDPLASGEELAKLDEAREKIQYALEDLRGTKWLRETWVKELEAKGLKPDKNLSLITDRARRKNLVNDKGEILGTISIYGNEVGAAGLNYKFHPHSFERTSLDKVKSLEELAKRLGSRNEAEKMLQQIEINNNNRFGEALYRSINNGIKDTRGNLITRKNFAETDLPNKITGNLEKLRRAQAFWESKIRANKAEDQGNFWRMIKKHGGDIDYHMPYYDQEVIYAMMAGGQHKKKLKKDSTSKNIKSSINKIMARNEDLFGPKGKSYFEPNVKSYYKTGGWLDDVK